MAETLSLLVACVEKIGGRIGCIVAAVGANIERSGWNGEPCEVANDCEDADGSAKWSCWSAILFVRSRDLSGGGGSK